MKYLSSSWAVPHQCLEPMNIGAPSKLTTGDERSSWVETDIVRRVVVSGWKLPLLKEIETEWSCRSELSCHTRRPGPVAKKSNAISGGSKVDAWLEPKNTGTDDGKVHCPAPGVREGRWVSQMNSSSEPGYATTSRSDDLSIEQLIPDLV
jgi:hypothetical protein